MRRFLFLGAGALLLALPLISLAYTIGDPLVPSEIVERAPYLRACDIVHLANNLIGFAVYLSVLVATVMFAYAGILYVTAASRQENLNQAKGIFGKVFLGLVIVLTSWLIIDIVLSVFTEKDFGFWSTIECVEAPTPTVPVGGEGAVIPGPAPIDSSLEGGPGGFAQIVPTPPLDHEQVLAQFEDAGIEVTSTSGNSEDVCANCSGFGKTSLQDMREATADTTVNLQQACDCKITVTGGTEEDVHRPGIVSHGTGFKIDYDNNNQALNDYIEKSGKFTRIQDRSGRPQYRDHCGNTYVRESTHWDATIVQKCSF